MRKDKGGRKALHDRAPRSCKSGLAWCLSLRKSSPSRNKAGREAIPTEDTAQPSPGSPSVSSLLACCLVCSFNVQPEFPSSVTNFSSHHGSGEQIILVAADNSIFQDHITGQWGCHVIWLYPHFIVKWEVILLLIPLLSESLVQKQFSLL